jgi:hypothetical protein
MHTHTLKRALTRTQIYSHIHTARHTHTHKQPQSHVTCTRKIPSHGSVVLKTMHTCMYYVAHTNTHIHTHAYTHLHAGAEKLLQRFLSSASSAFVYVYTHVCVMYITHSKYTTHACTYMLIHTIHRPRTARPARLHHEYEVAYMTTKTFPPHLHARGLILETQEQRDGGTDPRQR